MRQLNKRIKRLPPGSYVESVLVEEDDSENSMRDIAFFFGAGASVRAGVPDTFSFVDEFIKNSESPEKEHVQFVRDVLNKWGAEQLPSRIVDIELLLEALEGLANRKEDVVLPFFHTEKSLLPEKFDASVILTKLRNFIKEKVIVEVQEIQYLGPLRGFIQIVRPLDIYSANYDTCIELFCSEHKLDYKDGFDEAWNPRVFDDDDLDVRLYKIHGSVTWYRSNRGRYLKVPVLNSANTVDLVTKERAESLMLYPAQKFEYVEPLFELLILMKQNLLSCKTLIVIGYSFRDDHIRRIFWDVARRNRELKIILISPNSWQLYKDRLKLYEDGKTPSMLSGKVICLPYKFEDVLRILKDEILSNVIQARTCLMQQESLEVSSRPQNWTIDCVLSIARSGDIESLRIALDKEVQKYSQYFSGLLESSVLGTFYAAAHMDNDMLLFFWGKLKDTILTIVDRFRIIIQPSTSQLQVTGLNGTTEYPHEIINTIAILEKLIAERRQWLIDSIKNSNKIDLLLAVLIDFHNTFHVWSKNSVNFDDYLAVRDSCPKIIKDDLHAVSGKDNCMYDGRDKTSEIIKGVTDLEKLMIQTLVETYEKKFAAVVNGEGM